VNKNVERLYVTKNMRWLSMRCPSVGLAQNANMTVEEFNSVYFDIASTDYSKLSKAMDKLFVL